MNAGGLINAGASATHAWPDAPSGKTHVAWLRALSPILTQRGGLNERHGRSSRAQVEATKVRRSVGCHARAGAGTVHPQHHLGCYSLRSITHSSDA